VFDAISLGCSSSIKLLCNCAQKKESAFTELGLTPKHDRLIACFSPLQTKARIAAEQVDATALPHPWIGSEQGSTYSHEDHRFRYFLDHSHPSLGDEILACHTALTAVTTTSTNPPCVRPIR
jgi:hypothetical protein